LLERHPTLLLSDLRVLRVSPFDPPAHALPVPPHHLPLRVLRVSLLIRQTHALPVRTPKGASCSACPILRISRDRAEMTKGPPKRAL